MNRKPFIAFLLNLCVFPGFGHLYLRQRIKGYALSLMTCLILLFLLVWFESDLYQQMKLLESPRAMLSNIFSLSSKAIKAHSEIHLGGIVCIGLVWIYGAVDVWRRK